MPRTMEPVRTIYTEDWVRARSEVEKLVGRGQAEPFGPALAQLEAGWEHVRPLERWCEERERAPDPGDAEDAVRWHVEMEVVDLFRWLANETLLSIPRPRSKWVAASVDDLVTEVEALGRSVRVLLLAVRDDSIPASVRRLVEDHGAPLVGWAADYGQNVLAIRRYLDAAASQAIEIETETAEAPRWAPLLRSFGWVVTGRARGGLTTARRGPTSRRWP